MAFLIVALATWRVSLLLVREAGPGDILARFRRFVGVYYDELSQPVRKNVIADALTCVWCTSVWVGFFFAALWLIHERLAFYVALPFALSAVVIILDELIQIKNGK